jgi:hypothetical protein
MMAPLNHPHVPDSHGWSFDWKISGAPHLVSFCALCLCMFATRNKSTRTTMKPPSETASFPEFRCLKSCPSCPGRGVIRAQEGRHHPGIRSYCSLARPPLQYPPPVPILLTALHLPILTCREVHLGRRLANILNCQILTLNKTDVVQSLPKRRKSLRISLRRTRADKPNHRHYRLLRARRERPRGPPSVPINSRRRMWIAM